MWKLYLLAAIGAGTGYFAGCMKQKKREKRNCSPKKKEVVQSSLLNSPFNADMEARIVTEQGQQAQGDLWLSYGVGIGVMRMISTGNQKIDKFSLLLSQTADLLQELKGQLQTNRNHMKNADVFKSVYRQNSGSGSVGTPSEENASTRSVVTDESVSESSSIAMVEGGLCANGLPGYHSSSENKTPTPLLKISDVDNYGVSPYELDRHLRDLLEKQQEEKISELDMQLKSMEAKLCAKERELQQWKDRVQGLAEHSFGATSSSGEDSPTFERASDDNGRGQYLMHGLSNSSSKLSVSSAHEGNSQLPWEFSSYLEEQLDYSEKTACNYAGQTNLAYAEAMEASRLASDSRDSIDPSCIDFLNALADVESSRCQYKSDGNLRQTTDQRFSKTFDRESRTSSC